MDKNDLKESSGNRILNLLFTWKLQINLSTIFILMISFFALAGNIYTNISDKNQIKSFSNIVTKELSEMVHRSVGQVVEQTYIAGEAVSALVTKTSDVNLSNKNLINLITSILDSDPYIQRISVSAQDGSSISVLYLLDNDLEYFHFNPSMELPPNCFYAIRSVIPKGSNREETWLYLNRNFELVTKESIPNTEYDPRKFKWYQNVVEYPRPQWDQDVIQTNKSREIAYTIPVVNADLDVIAAVKIVLSLDQVSNLLAYQKIGQTGWAVILDNKGVPIAPSEDNHPEQDDLLNLLFKEYPNLKSIGQEQKELYLNEKEYLVRVSKFPLGFETEWYIVIFSQFTDIFGPFLKAQNYKNIISVIMVSCFAVVVFFFSRRIAYPIEQLADSVNRITNLDFSEIPKISSRIKEIISLNKSILGLRSALLSFSRYVPKEVVKTFINQGHVIEIQSERRDLTILFSDIQNFTTIAETISSELLTKFLSEYFGVFSKIIVSNEGTIDKYIGDSIMAFWNAPTIVIDQGQKACLAALQFKKVIEKFDGSNNLLKAKTRFGIHSGEVLVGNIGTQERMNYTVVGNAVNTASRLESLNKTYGTTILISESTHEKIGLRFITRPIDYIVVKGRTQGITVFELLGLREDNLELSATKEERGLSEEFSSAFKAYQEGHFDDAKVKFEALNKKFSEDVPTKLYLERLQGKIKS